MTSRSPSSSFLSPFGPLGAGIGWRPELARAIDRRPGIGFIEILAENFNPAAPVPPPIRQLQDRGVRVIPHGVSLSLGSAEGIDPAGVRRLEELARRFDSPLVSEHVAFVRAGGAEAGHLLPVPRTRTALAVLVDNVRRARDLLSVPLALENISRLFDWPDEAGPGGRREPQVPEVEFLAELLERTGALLLLDVANVCANARNLAAAGDPAELPAGLSLDRVAYVHVGGGQERDGVYHDTHAHAVPQGALELLEELCSRTEPPGVMLERDDDFPPEPELFEELDRIEAAVQRGRSRRGAKEAARG